MHYEPLIGIKRSVLYVFLPVLFLGSATGADHGVFCLFLNHVKVKYFLRQCWVCVSLLECSWTLQFNYMLTRAQKKICCESSFWFVKVVRFHSSSSFFQLCFSSPAPVSKALKHRLCFKHVLNSLSTSCTVSLSFRAFLSRESLSKCINVLLNRSLCNTLVNKFPASGLQGANFRNSFKVKM